ncbi:MAG: hypothetical protein WA474_19910 [Candidatus Sulfotelmatobacter sp.]
MNKTKPPWLSDIPLTLRPLRRFDYGLVRAKLDGLLFNVDRDPQRRVKNLEQRQEWHSARQLVGVNTAALFTKNSYNAVRYLIADTPEDHNRKPNYVLIVPAVNRQLLDLLFTLVYMFDDYPARALAFERAGWKESKQEYEMLHNRFCSDPEWEDFFTHRGRILDEMANFLGLTPDERRNISLIPWWGTPTQLMRKKTQSRPFLNWLYEWFYQDLSRTAHLSSSGVYRIPPFVLAEIVRGRDKEIVDSHVIQIFRFTQMSRLALIV